MRPIVKLGEAVDFSQGIQVPIEDQSMVEKSGLVRFLRIVDFTQGNQDPRYVENFGDRYFVKKDDISMVRYGTPGFVCSGLEGIIANNLFKITPKNNDIYKRYLYFYFKSPYFLNYLDRESSGVAMKAINFGSLKNIQIPLPPLETQKAIVAKLDQIFAELDQTKSEIQKNLDNTDELWKSALNQAFQGDWEMKKLGEVIKLVSGQDLTTKEYNSSGNGIPYITGASNIENESIIINRWTEFPKSIAKEGDLLITVKGTVGTMAILQEEKVHIARQIMAIENKEPITILYIKLFLETYIQKLKNSANGLIPGISRSVVLGIEIPVPPLSEQEKIVEHLDQVSKEVKALKSQYQSQLDNLEELKKSVLDKAFRGEME